MADGRSVLTDDEVLRVKANEEGLNINQWSLELGVTYRTIQKLVFGITYRDVGKLSDVWDRLKDRQKPGPKGPRNPRLDRKPNPSKLSGHEADIRKLYEGFLERLAEKYGCKRLDILRALSVTSKDGGRLGRAAKFSAREVADMREKFQNHHTYADLAREYDTSRTTIARVLGRGSNGVDSYTPRVVEAYDDEG